MLFSLGPDRQLSYIPPKSTLPRLRPSADLPRHSGMPRARLQLMGLLNPAEDAAFPKGYTSSADRTGVSQVS